MADLDSLQKSHTTQVIDSQPEIEETIHSLGAVQAADGLIEYLREASPSSLSNMFIKNAGETAECRREFVALLEGWLDGLALQKFIAWQSRQPRKVNGNGSKAAGRLEPVPEDMNSLDPFFRGQAQSAAIRRETPPIQAKIWPLHFEKFGCLVCQDREPEHYAGSGFCRRCHSKITARRKEIELELRLEAARMGG